ncbi:hypothetical protein QMZ92_25925 [Streptomyces sp. HNM0645]|uniref:hypothetical protein n=1 Tax=Streptomyces sp. HNM0645 TaxID=2782343 RepID=UPI0024B7FA57|nr:hypothetical protein [Streptomyces sp. HNM0645]MDI9887713.1 hypothetical protein [Streptomyces sp. HNM0645]
MSADADIRETPCRARCFAWFSGTGDGPRAPSRSVREEALAAVLTAAAAVVATLAGLLIHQYNDRPPWADDVAYKGGYLLANRIRKADVTGERTRELRGGGCARLLRAGAGARRATHNPGLWVAVASTRRRGANPPSRACSTDARPPGRTPGTG